MRVVSPVIILGAPRSGTTMLATLFEQHPDVTVVREPRLVWRFGNDRRSDELRPEHATPKVVAHIHSTFDARLLPGRRQLVEKTPANSLRPRFVDAVYHDAKFLHITRNGWSAVPALRDHWHRRAEGFGPRERNRLKRRLKEAKPSQIPAYTREFVRRFTGRISRHHALNGPRLAGLQSMVDELGVLETAARQWRDCVLQSATFGRQLPSDRYLELKLEDLSPAAVDRMLEFAGLKPSAALADLFAETYDPAKTASAAALSDADEVVLAPYVVAANLWLGYPDRPGEGASGPTGPRN